MAAQYTEIYDLDNKSHREPKWDVDERWRYYEGYGQGSCQEKTAFLASVKKDHPLWSSDSPAEKIRKVSFNESLDWMSDAKSGSGVVDMADRVDRVTWNSSKMMVDFVEKTNRVGRENFFNYGGGGMKWAKNKDMMENIGEHLGRINQRLVDPKFKISLADQTVKDYPRTHFKFLMEKFEEFVKNGSKMPMEWATAMEFVPSESSAFQCKVQPLARTCPEKVAGAYSVSPPKPGGAPPPRRPSASSKASVSQLCWAMKQESDVKIDDLQKKIDILIAMNGPVVQAKIVS